MTFAARTAAALLLIGLMGACGSDDAPIATALDIATSENSTSEPAPTTADQPTAASTPGPAATAVTPPAPPTPTTPTPTTAPATPAPAGGDDGDGGDGGDGDDDDDDFPGWLRVNGFGPVDFGSSLASAQTAIAPRFGEPSDIASGGDCFLTVANWDEFSLAFDADELVGWFYTSSTPSLESPSGVAPGISQSDLRRVYSGVDIAESTLGLEFFFEVPAGFIGGFFTPDEQTVSSMFAGQNCFFR